MRNRRLEVEIVDGELRISIGVDTLKFAVENAPEPPLVQFDEDTEQFMGFQINDPDVFAEDVKLALLDEEEDGTTPVHALLDEAAMTAIEEGSLAVDEETRVVEY